MSSFGSRFTTVKQKIKQVMHTKKFVKIYNWQSKKLVYKTHIIVEIEKYLILIGKNLLNLISYIYIVLKDTVENIFYLNNSIDLN